MCCTKNKTKVIVLAGFLGAGKTTLLRQILSWETDLSDTVVIVNEFGKVGIDGLLLRQAASDVVELASGCICCTLKADLIQTLKKVLERFAPEKIFIEATGLADPISVTSVFRESDLREHMEICRVITVLDADYWENREAFGPLFYNQLREADLILLNKIDTIGENTVPRFLKEIHEVIPGSRVVPTIHCRVDPETLVVGTRDREPGIAPGQFFHKDILPVHDEHDHAHEHHSREDECHTAEAGYVTFSFQDSQALDETCFKRFTKELPWELFRMKGTVCLGNNRSVLVNFVGGKSEWAEWDGDHETRLAFVGWRVDGEEIIQRLKQCVPS